MRTVARLVAALSLLIGSSCASTFALDRSWIEARSPNFSIYTPLAEADAREMLENLELFRAAILVVTKVRKVDPHVPTEIYAFDDYGSFKPAANVVGYFIPGLRSNLVSLDAGGAHRKLARATLYHEYTHFLLHNEGRNTYPLWFGEGFADVLSSVDVLGGMVRVGVVPSHRVDWIRYAAKLPYSRVLHARNFTGWNTSEVGSFYAQSWLLVHYLTLGQGGSFPPLLDRYLTQVRRGVDEDDAFRSAFGIDVGDLRERLRNYQRQVPSFGLPRGDLAKGLTIDVRAVPLDEIGMRLGWLALANAKLALAQRLFERAIEANPVNSRAIVGLAELHKFAREWEPAESGYRRGLELAPDDWQNQLEFAEYFAHRALLEKDGRDEHLVEARTRLARVIELVPQIPEGHAMLGVTYTVEGQKPEPGIDSLERAAKLLPSNPMIEYPLAQLHERAGHRDRAIELLRRVVHRAHGNTNPEAVSLLERLESESAGS